MLERGASNQEASASADTDGPSWEQEDWEPAEAPADHAGADEQRRWESGYAAEDEEDQPGQHDGQLNDAQYEEESNEQRALVPQQNALAPAPRGLQALARLSGEPGDLSMLEGRATGAIMVPGSGKPRRPGALGQSFFSLRARRPRPFLMQVSIILLVFLATATTAFAMAPLNTEGQVIDSFTSLGGFLAPPSSVPAHYRVYVVHYGDSLKSIADRFGVLQGGILELNGLHSADDLFVGMRLLIPNDASYGQDFQSVVNIPIPPPDQFGNRFGTDPWNSTAGTTDPQNICAPQGNSDNLADRQKFQLINPNPNSSFARGFTWYHNGVDLDNPAGTPILAAQAGLVLFGGWDIGGLGWSVKINNCWGLSTIYGHMMLPPLVHGGDYVQVGQQIGQEGSTGNSTGPHLHFMTEWFNQWANPYCFDFVLPAGDTPCTAPS